MLGRRVPMILQSEAPECGIACVAMVASFHGFRTDLSAMRLRLPPPAQAGGHGWSRTAHPTAETRLRLAPSMKGVTLKHISAIADTMKLGARGVKVPLESLHQLKVPAILHWDMNHFVVLTKASRDTITVNDPGAGRRGRTLKEA